MDAENVQPDRLESDEIISIDAHQLVTWDIEGEIYDPTKPIYIQVFTCEVCDVILPYPKAEHDCLEETETDEGFEENEDYMDEFDACVDFLIDDPFYFFVTPCYCGDLHLMDERNGNHNGIQIIRVNQQE